MKKENIKIESTMVDSSRHLKLPAFFSLIQDIATADAENVGLGKNKTMDKGLLWVFTRVYVEFYDTPSYMDECELSTYPGKRKMFFFPRYVELHDSKGNPLAKCSTIWVLIDEKTRRAILKPEIDVDADQTKGDELPLPEKTNERPSSFVYSRIVRYSDVDLNGHLNNVRYIEMIVDLLSSEEHREKRLASFLINYLKEVKEGEEVELYANEDRTYVKGVVDGQTRFEAEIVYR